MVFFQAEADLRVAQSEFDKQSEILKLLLEGIQTVHVSLLAIFSQVRFRIAGFRLAIFSHFRIII